MKNSLKKLLKIAACVILAVLIACTLMPASVNFSDVYADREITVEETTMEETTLTEEETEPEGTTEAETTEPEETTVEETQEETTVAETIVEETSVEETTLMEEETEPEGTTEEETTVEETTLMEEETEPEGTTEAETTTTNDNNKAGIENAAVINAAGDYLTFTAQQAGSTVTFNYVSGTNVQYSTDGGTNWTGYTQGTTITLANVGDTVSFKGQNVKTFITNHFSMTGLIAASGDVTSLTNGIGGDVALHDLTDTRCYSYMFYQCSSLTSVPNLPSTTIAKECYAGMFSWCTSLTAVPQNLLPALTAKYRCYDTMFWACSSLTNVPDLPATTLDLGCYESMFRDCRSLTTVPTTLLPATTAVTSCYRSMFSGCTALTVVPDLPATTLAGSCYESMFSGCRSLTTVPQNLLQTTTATASCYKSMFSGCSSLTGVPDLPATTLAGNCYESMFSGCTALTTVPTTLLSAMTAASSCYKSMFSGCSSLTGVPDLPATTLAGSCYESMFSGCTALTTVSTTLLSAMTAASSCYKNMFSSCSSLTGVPDLPATTLAGSCYESMFSGCTSLQTTPAMSAQSTANNCCYGMFNGCTALSTASSIGIGAMAEGCCQKMFNGCSSLTVVPIITAQVMEKNCCNQMFQGCTSLVTAPTMTITSMAENSCQSMFYGCSSLTTIPISTNSNTTMAVNCCNNMFSHCTSLTTIPAVLVSATTMASSCYAGMFEYCSSLTTLMVLPATTLADNCYKNMFGYCSSLTVIPNSMLPATTLEKHCYDFMFYYCSKLATIPSDLLPATTLAEGCYEGMFYSCGITTVPSDLLPTTTLAVDCYASMFSGCTKLTNAPELPATIMANGCYSRMFRDCYVLEYAPDIKATQLADECFLAMFQYCSKLTMYTTGDPNSAWSIPCTSTSATDWGNWMFGYTAGDLTGAPALGTTYYQRKIEITESMVSGINSSYEYTGIAITPEPVITYGGTTLTKGTDYTVAYNNNKDAGTATVTITGMGAYSTTPLNITFSITRKTLTVTPDSGQSKVYDGKTTSISKVSITYSVSGAVNGEVPAFNGSLCVSSDPANAGTYNIEKNTLALKNTGTFKASNYSLSVDETVTYEIRPREVVILWGNTSFVYNGQSHCPTATVDNLVFNWQEYEYDNCSITVTGAQTNEGTYTATAAVLTGASASNYVLPASPGNTTTFTILSSRYLTFTALEDISYVRLNYFTASSVEYSMDNGVTWNRYTNGSTIVLRQTGDTVCFRGTNVTTNRNNHFQMGGTIAASGDVTSLTNEVGGDVTLTGNCYISMFYECTALTTAPSLPSTTLAEMCYAEMFYGCTSLTTAPATLPATIMEDGCYICMFQNCESLVTAPNIMATTMANYCCEGMFADCKSLAEAPTLSAIILADDCYGNMFLGCESLTTVPTLPATTLPSGCYYGMFKDCKNITLYNQGTDEWSIPGNAGRQYGWGTDMFKGTGGDLQGQPVPGTTYYQAKKIITADMISGIDPEYIYIGTEITPEPVVVDEGVTLVKGTDYDVTYENNKNVGTATVIITGKGVYSDTPVKITFTIVPREVTLTWGNTVFIYDGNVHKPEVTVGNIVGDDIVEVTVIGEETDANAKTGRTYRAKVTALNNANYKLPSYLSAVSPEFTVVQKEVELVWNETQFTYDGEQHCPTVTVAKESLVGSDTCNVTGVDGAQTNAGKYTAAAVSLDNSNYCLPVAKTREYVIASAELTITADDASSTRNTEEIKPLTAKITSGQLYGSDTITISASTKATKTSDAGTYDIVPSYEFGKDTIEENYEVTLINGKYTLKEGLGTGTSPTTSDQNNLWIWILLAGTAATVIVVIVYRRRRSEE